MWKSGPPFVYNALKYNNTYNMYKKIYKNKADEQLSIDEMRTEMAKYVISNQSKYHKNSPKLLNELQQHHKNQYFKLENLKKNVEAKLEKIESSDNNMTYSMLLVEMNYKINNMLYNHRKQIKKVNDVKNQDADFWTSKIPEE